MEIKIAIKYKNAFIKNAIILEISKIKNAKRRKPMFKRKIYDKMLQWKNESGGNTALLVEGARRIGKSTVVEEFAKNEYESYILVDFATASKEVRELFDDVSDLNYLFLQLQLQYICTNEGRLSYLMKFSYVLWHGRL